MLALQSSPIEMSSPARVFRPLWHATHRSDVRNTVTGDTLSPFAFSVLVCEWPRTNGREPSHREPEHNGTSPRKSHPQPPQSFPSARSQRRYNKTCGVRPAVFVNGSRTPNPVLT